MDTAFIYWIHLPEHTDCTKQGYVGVTKNPDRRLIQHRNIDKNKRHDNIHLSRAFEKYKDKITIKTLMVGSIDYCFEMETKLRPTVNIGWNINKGGDKPPVNYNPSYLWELNKGNKYRTGILHTEETKIRISKSLKHSDHRVHKEGHTQETRDKMKITAPKSTLGKRWYYNPIDGQANFFFPDTQPAGWLKGRK